MRRWLFSVCVIVSRGLRGLDSTAVVRMEASMQSAWSVSVAVMTTLLFLICFKAGGSTKATLLCHLFLEPSDIHVDDRIRTTDICLRFPPGMIILGNTKPSNFLSFLKQLY